MSRQNKNQIFNLQPDGYGKLVQYIDGYFYDGYGNSISFLSSSDSGSGKIGATGPQGTQGSDGPQGYQGTTGPQGTQGPTNNINYFNIAGGAPSTNLPSSSFKIDFGYVL